MGDQDYSSDAGLKRPPPPDDSYGYGGGQGGGNYEQGGNYQDDSSYNYDPSGQADSGYTYDPNASNTGSAAAQYDPNANSGGQYNQTGNSGGSGYEQSGGDSQQQGGGGGYQQRGGGGYNNQGNNNYRGRGGGRGRGRGGNNYNKQNFYNQGGNNYNNQSQGGGYNQQTYYTQGNDYNYDAEGGDYGYMSKKRRIIDDVYRFLVPTRTVRVIIGKGGETIKSIKSIVPESKISIYAQGTNNSEIPHNASDRVMSVQCPLESLSKILMELVPKMQLFEGGKLDIRLLVPQHSCSAVIGQKGATIKQIKEETNSSFIGVHNDPLPNSEEHVVKVINTDLQGCVDAVVRVCASITETKGKQHVTFYDPQIWPKGSCGDTGSWLETASDYGGGRGRGRGRGRGFYGNRGGGGGGYGGGNSGYYNNQQYGGGYDNQQGENQSYNYDPNTETGGENTKSEGGQDNYVSYPSY